MKGAYNLTVNWLVGQFASVTRQFCQIEIAARSLARSAQSSSNDSNRPLQLASSEKFNGTCLTHKETQELQPGSSLAPSFYLSRNELEDAVFNPLPPKGFPIDE